MRWTIRSGYLRIGLVKWQYSENAKPKCPILSGVYFAFCIACNQCNWIYEIIYGAKSKLYNVFSNVIPVVGLILYSMVSSDMISIPILEYIGAEIYVILIYIPLLSFNMKIYTEARRLCK